MPDVRLRSIAKEEYNKDKEGRFWHSRTKTRYLRELVNEVVGLRDAGLIIDDAAKRREQFERKLVASNAYESMAVGVFYQAKNAVDDGLSEKKKSRSRQNADQADFQEFDESFGIREFMDRPRAIEDGKGARRHAWPTAVDPCLALLT